MSGVQSNLSFGGSIDGASIRKITETRINHKNVATKNSLQQKISESKYYGEQITNTATTSLNLITKKPKILKKANYFRKNAYPLRNHKISDVKNIVDQMKTVDFLDTPPSISSSEYSLRILDADDKTSEDQSQLWNRNEYIQQKRFIEKKKMDSYLPEIIEKNERSKKYRFEDILDAQDSFEEEIRKFKQELQMNFNENLSCLIDARQKAPCVQIERTLEKEKNKKLRNEEIDGKIEKYREQFLIKRQKERKAHILEKQKRRELEENFIINLALEDHHKLLIRPVLKSEKDVEDLEISNNENDEQGITIDLDKIESSLLKKISYQPNNPENLETFEEIKSDNKPITINNSPDYELSPIKEHLTESTLKIKTKVKKILTLKPKKIKYKRFSLPLHFYGRKRKIDFQQYQINTYRVSSKEAGFFENLIEITEKHKLNEMRTKRHNRMKYLRIPIRKYVRKPNSFESKLCSSTTSFETANWISDRPLLTNSGQNFATDCNEPNESLTRNFISGENINYLETGNNEIGQENGKVYRSRLFYENDLPGKKKYLDLIKSITGTGEAKEELPKVKCDKTASKSTIYTNFTNDSGSHIIFGEKKIPLNILRNPLIPIDRSSCLELLNTEIADMNGMKRKDQFHTYATRLRSDLRNRLQIPNLESPEMNKDMQTQQQILQETTSEIKKIYKRPQNRFLLKQFKPKSTLSLVRNALRQKVEMHYIKERIVEEDVNHKKEAEYAKETVDRELQYYRLFTIWKEHNYTTSRDKIYSMKPLYDTTDVLTQDLNNLKRQKIEISNNIVLIKEDLIRRTILQKFNYLMGDESWRQEHDWIHRKPDGIVEEFAQSIEKRKNFNMSERDCDDAWAIKKFYDQHFLDKNFLVEIVFDNWEHFVSAYLKLRSKTFISLKHFHFTTFALINARYKYQQFKEWSNKYIEERTNFANNRFSKKYIIENRVKSLEDITNNLIDKPLRNSLKSYKKMESLCEVLYGIMMPNLIRADTRDSFGPIEKLQIVFDSAIDLLAEIDKIPLERRKIIEKSYRKQLQYLQYKSREAYVVEERLRITLKKLRRSFEPPPTRKIQIKSTVNKARNLLHKKPNFNEIS